MTKKRDAINFTGYWRPPMPPPSPDATILNYLNDSETGAPLSFVGFWRPSMTPPPTDATILNYLNDREREGGGMGALSFCRILAPPQCPPPTSKILYYLNDTDGGRYYFCKILAPPNAPPPQTPQYLTILLTGITFVRLWRPPPPRRHNT